MTNKPHPTPLSSPSPHRAVWWAGVLSLALLASFAQAREGVDVGRTSTFAKFVPAEDLENSAQQQYLQLAGEAKQQNALLPDDHPQVQRLRSIAKRIVPYSYEWNERAKEWQWQVIALNSKELNAFCMPGGKIAFYTGLLNQLKLTDDEVAMVMGHEIAHALREHARERMGKTAATKMGANVVSSLFGLGATGDTLLNMGGQLLTLKFSREDESEADLVGMELAARSGYDPRAGISLWHKMAEASKGAPPQWLSTHPASDTRVHEIEANLNKVMPLYERAAKPDQRWDGQPIKAAALASDAAPVESSASSGPVKPAPRVAPKTAAQIRAARLRAAQQRAREQAQFAN